jgi:hypothetical protein
MKKPRYGSVKCSKCKRPAISEKMVERIVNTDKEVAAFVKGEKHPRYCVPCARKFVQDARSILRGFGG